MLFIKTKDYTQMSQKVASLLLAQVISKPDSVLGLATGSTPIGAYENLAKWYTEGLVDFSRVHTVNLDEYMGLDKEHNQSYYYFMKKNLFSKINIPDENIKLPSGVVKDFDAECLSYETYINALGGIDLQLLGLGHNGHIGFNEPASDFPNITHCVNLTESTIQANKRFFEKIEDVPTKAITMGIGTIMKAKCVVLAVNGIGKAEIVQKAFFGPVVPSIPASILQFHPNVIIVGDEESFQLISDRI